MVLINSAKVVYLKKAYKNIGLAQGGNKIQFSYLKKCIMIS